MRPDLWTCPRCHRQFANENQSHSCVVRTVEQFLADKSAAARELFDRFDALALSVGQVTHAPALTRVGYQARMIFASVNKLGPKGLDAHVVLARRFEHPRFLKVESFSPRNHAHFFRITSPDQVDETVEGWLKEAYLVGEQEHLK